MGELKEKLVSCIIIVDVDKQPKTIEELKQWYVNCKLPPEEVTRFFIGKDVREPRAFGIYQDSSWYYYNDLLDDWSHVDSSQVPEINFTMQEEYTTDTHEGMQFEDSTWYVEESYRSYDSYDDYDDDWDDDWDSDYDWDSGDSWDSGGTDWDSDW